MLVKIDYTNWLDRRRYRLIKPISIRFGSNEFHKEPQWLLRAVDTERNVEREFALKDIHSWSQVATPTTDRE